ncbi:hypothetical protein VZT92_022687 [Zoarces viviparus]|uniref:Uncharacterized protein n=1 Tax=Zoarces viviparus TaxID=48416 RepID=A0AAW1ECS0_ZOAVI
MRQPSSLHQLSTVSGCSTGAAALQPARVVFHHLPPQCRPLAGIGSTEPGSTDGGFLSADGLLSGTGS